MSTPAPTSTPVPRSSAPADGLTEKVNPIACLDERARRAAAAATPVEPGCYIEAQGPQETLLVPLERGVTHVGRGLAADLRLDDKSVSRRHAMLVRGSSSTRILDDRSSNGTFVNARRIEQAELSNGDVIVLGRVVLRYLEW